MRGRSYPYRKNLIGKKRSFVDFLQKQTAALVHRAEICNTFAKKHKHTNTFIYKMIHSCLLKIFCGCGLLLFPFVGVKSQKLHVQKTDATEAVTDLSSIRSLVFLGQTLNLCYENGAQTPYAIAEVQKVWFSDLSSIPSDANSEGIAAERPATPQLISAADGTVVLRGVSSGTLTVRSIDGRYNRSVNYEEDAELDLSDLPEGFYLISIQSHTFKYIKQ